MFSFCSPFLFFFLLFSFSRHLRRPKYAFTHFGSLPTRIGDTTATFLPPPPMLARKSPIFCQDLSPSNAARSDALVIVDWAMSTYGASTRAGDMGVMLSRAWQQIRCGVVSSMGRQSWLRWHQAARHRSRG